MAEATGWGADDIARWEALEAEARDRLEAEAREEAGRPDPQPSNAAWDEAAPSWYRDDNAATPGAAPAQVTVAPPDPATPPESSAAPAEARGFVPEILLADADPAVAASLEQAMIDRGWVVRVVDNGEMAVVEFVRQSPHVFVFDYSLPGLGGLDLLRRLAEFGVTDGPRIVANSTQTQAIHVQRARAMGAHRFLDRPLRGPEPVVDAVAGQLDELAAEGGPDARGAAAATEPAPPAPSAPASTALVPGLFVDTPTTPEPSAEDPATSPEQPSTDGGSYRSAFGSGGGPPGRVPRLG